MRTPCEYDLAADVDDACSVEREAHPEQFGLVLRDQHHRSGRADQRRDVGQVMRAAGNHRRGGSGAGRSHHAASAVVPLEHLLEVDKQTDLYSEPGAQRDDEVPEAGELLEREVPARDQGEDTEVRAQQPEKGKRPEAE